jgi:hypothetical protein
VQGSGLAVEGVDLEPRVVREGGKATGDRKGGGLYAGIFFVVPAGLVDFERETNISRGDQLPAAVRQKGAKLAHLAGVVGAEKETTT